MQTEKRLVMWPGADYGWYKRAVQRAGFRSSLGRVRVAIGELAKALGQAARDLWRVMLWQGPKGY